MTINSFTCSDPNIINTPITSVDEVPEFILKTVIENEINKLRDERNKLLEDTDKFMMLSDIPNMTSDKINELRIYRQKLRDYMNELNINDYNGLNKEVLHLLPIKPSFIK